MRRLLIELLTAAAVVAVPIVLSAQEPPRAGRPDPESVFKRLDVNKDGVILRRTASRNAGADETTVGPGRQEQRQESHPR